LDSAFLSCHELLVSLLFWLKGRRILLARRGCVASAFDGGRAPSPRPSGGGEGQDMAELSPILRGTYRRRLQPRAPEEEEEADKK
jgi:hypothetical protein